MAGRGPQAGVGDLIQRFRQMAAEVGRDPAEVPLSFFGAREDLDQVKHLRDLGVSRLVVALDSEKEDTILPVLDRWAAVIRALEG